MIDLTTFTYLCVLSMRENRKQCVGKFTFSARHKNNNKMTDLDVEMVETGTHEMEVDTSDTKSKAIEASSSKSLDVAPRAYELPWLLFRKCLA